MEPEQFKNLVSYGSEKRHLEFKSSMNWQNEETKIKVVKSILALSNIRDGGYLIFGVDEVNSTIEIVGMEKEDYNSFEYDKVLSLVDKCSDPYVEFDLEKLNLDEGKFIVISVNQFNELPVICKSGGPGNKLQVGAIYIRTRRIIESAPISRHIEMREVIELATELRLGKIKEMAGKGGFITERDFVSNHIKKFEEQRKDFL